MTAPLAAQLRTAEERIRELEARLRYHEDRADRAERWVYKIWVEIEQKFFGGDAIRPLPPSGEAVSRNPLPAATLQSERRRG